MAKANGYIFTSTNLGVSFTQRTSSGSRSWSGVAVSANADKIIGAVKDGYLYTSTDFGVNWVERNNTSGPRRWAAIAGSTDGTRLCAVPGDIKGYVYTSIDAGQTWQIRTSSGFSVWQSVATSANGSVLMVAPDYGYIQISYNGGNTWSQRTSTGVDYFYSLAMSQDATRMVSASYIYGNKFLSADAGQTWVKRTEVFSTYIASLACNADCSTILAGASPGTYRVYVSTNFGLNWTEQASLGAGGWKSVWSSNDGSRFFAASSGGIFRSLNAGTNWTRMSSAGSLSWTSIKGSESDPNKAVAVVSTGMSTRRRIRAVRGRRKQVLECPIGYQFSAQVIFPDWSRPPMAAISTRPMAPAPRRRSAPPSRPRRVRPVQPRPSARPSLPQPRPPRQSPQAAASPLP